MSHKGFSHIGLSTLDLDKTREFYEGVLGFKPVVADTINVKEGGHLRHMFFDVGRDQLIAFLEPQDVPGVPAEYDAGINRGLGVPAGFYHFAFEAGSAAALAEKRDELRARGVETTDIVDHGWAQSIYFKDPNGLSLEYCCMVRNLTEDDATMRERFTIPRGALELDDTLSAKVPRLNQPGAGARPNDRAPATRARCTAPLGAGRVVPPGLRSPFMPRIVDRSSLALPTFPLPDPVRRWKGTSNEEAHARPAGHVDHLAATHLRHIDAAD